MTPQIIIETFPFSEDNRATYCPEDNKLRLYVGRVPRPEYDALRASGWTSTPKQSEAGQGEFAATWEKIPVGAFKKEGTAVATVLFTIKP